MTEMPMRPDQNRVTEAPKGIDNLNSQRARRERDLRLREREAPPKRPDR